MNKATHSTTRAEALRARKWWIVDATDLTVGRAATRIATLIKGKHKASYTPSLDTGDFVVVINAGKVRFTGKKEQDKLYFSHTMHPGGAKLTPAAKVRAKHPEDILIAAVKRMIPRNALGRAMMTKLKVYPGAEHPHAAQKPEALKISA
ncbi:MAG: 50S ribosomal protein L13 [Anaeromyxobacteraceae bacterium]